MLAPVQKTTYKYKVQHLVIYKKQQNCIFICTCNVSFIEHLIKCWDTIISLSRSKWLKSVRWSLLDGFHPFPPYTLVSSSRACSFSSSFFFKTFSFYRNKLKCQVFKTLNGFHTFKVWNQLPVEAAGKPQQLRKAGQKGFPLKWSPTAKLAI